MINTWQINKILAQAQSMSKLKIDCGIDDMTQATCKTVQAQLNKILTNKKAVYELNRLCRFLHDTIHLLDDEYHDEIGDFAGDFHEIIIHALKMAATMENVRLSPCRVCGHHLTELKVSCVIKDHFLEEGKIWTKCRHCRVVFILMDMW